MTPERVAEIRSLLTRATPGPWEAHYPPVTGDWYVTPAGNGRSGSICEVNNWQSEYGSYDAALIGATPTVIGELLAEVDRYRALCKRLTMTAGPESGSQLFRDGSDYIGFGPDFGEDIDRRYCLWCGAIRGAGDLHSPDCPWPEVLKEAGL